MTIKTIQQAVEQLACEDMTEDGIHHDDWADHEQVYQTNILNKLADIVENKRIK